MKKNTCSKIFAAAIFIMGFSLTCNALIDATGLEFKTKKPLQRIVSLAPSITENLYELGAGEKIVGVTIYCNRPKEAEAKEKIGTLQEINIEKIVSLRPDIVLASMDDNKKEAVMKLRKLGINVFVFDEESDFKTVNKHFSQLGEIINAKNKAEKILKDIDVKMKKIENKVKNLSPLKVFFQLGADPIVSAGKGAFVDEFIQLSNGINIAHDLPGRYMRYTREQVIKENPDIIIIASMGVDTEKEKKGWEKFDQLSAVKNGRVVLINADLICRSAPTVLIQGLEEIAKTIHPEAFK